MAKAHKSRYAILGILATAPGSSGYDIQSQMRESTDFFWKESFGSIYPVLEALEKEKLIAHLETSSVGRKRTTYTITLEGRGALNEWLMENVDLEQARNEMLLKIFFGELSSVDTSIKHIENYKQQLLERKSGFEQSRKTLPVECPHEVGLPFWLLTIEFGIRRLQASLEWCEHALDVLSQMKK